MPQIQRSDIPKDLFAHLLLRIRQRRIGPDAIKQLAAWLDTRPEVPTGDWFKRFPTMVVCGRGALVRTFLESTQTAVGEEV